MKENYSSLQESFRGNKPILYTSHNGQAGIVKRAECWKRQTVIFLIFISFCVNLAWADVLTKEEPSISPSVVTTLPEAHIQSLKLTSLQKRYSRLCSEYTALAKTCSVEVTPCMPCPEGWTHTEDKCYYFSDDKLDWNKSKESCESINGHLTIIHTQEQHVALEKIAHSFKGSDYYWIGLSDIEEEGVWKWVDNTLVNTTYWNEWDKEPNNHQSGGPQGEDCVVLNSHSKSWYDVPCDNIYKHICETDAITVN